MSSLCKKQKNKHLQNIPMAELYDFKQFGHIYHYPLDLDVPLRHQISDWWHKGVEIHLIWTFHSTFVTRPKYGINWKYRIFRWAGIVPFVSR